MHAHCVELEEAITVRGYQKHRVIFSAHLKPVFLQGYCVGGQEELCTTVPTAKFESETLQIYLTYPKCSLGLLDTCARHHITCLSTWTRCDLRVHSTLDRSHKQAAASLTK